MSINNFQGKYEIPLIVFDAKLEKGFEALPDLKVKASN
jgi:hypothetical protein